VDHRGATRVLKCEIASMPGEIKKGSLDCHRGTDHDSRLFVGRAKEDRR